MPDAISAVPTLASSANLSPVTKSTGRWISTLFFLAFSISLGTSLEPSSSNSDLPIWQCIEIKSSCFRSLFHYLCILTRWPISQGVPRAHFILFHHFFIPASWCLTSNFPWNQSLVLDRSTHSFYHNRLYFWWNLTSILLRTLRKVKAMPPPIIISFTLSNMFSISGILSATLALQIVWYFPLRLNHIAREARMLQHRHVLRIRHHTTSSRKSFCSQSLNLAI